MKTILTLFILAAQFVSAQSILDSLDSDELFLRGRDLAFGGQRDSARVFLKAALEKSPTYADIRILLARTYAWDDRRDEAREELKIVLKEKPGYNDALVAAVDVEMWDDKLPDALKLVNQALRYFPNDEEFLIKRVKIFRDMNKDEEALITISILEDINRSNPNIQPLRESIKTKGLVNSVGGTYSYDWFSQRFDPQQLFTLQYGRSTSFGSIIGKINIANRFNTTAFQFELDAYPPIVDGVYGFLNYGFSGQTLFPEHRFGAEVFFKLPESFEGSLGFRYLYFGKGSTVTIYTGSLGYYWGNYWFSLRPYITPGNVSFSRSLSLTVRRYFGGEGDYIYGKIGGGVSPDEGQFVDTLGANLYNLKSQSVGVGFQYIVDIYSSLNVSFDYTDQELPANPGNFMKIYSVSVGYKYKF